MYNTTVGCLHIDKTYLLSGFTLENPHIYQHGRTQPLFYKVKVLYEDNHESNRVIVISKFYRIKRHKLVANSTALEEQLRP